MSRISGSDPVNPPGVLDLLEKEKNHHHLRGLTRPARIPRESREPRGSREVSTETSDLADLLSSSLR